MRKMKRQGKRARRYGRSIVQGIGNGAGRNRWARGTAKRRSLHGRNYKKYYSYADRYR